MKYFISLSSIPLIPPLDIRRTLRPYGVAVRGTRCGPACRRAVQENADASMGTIRSTLRYASALCGWKGVDSSLSLCISVGRRRDRSAPFQPHRADACATRTSPGRSQKEKESLTTPRRAWDPEARTLQRSYTFSSHTADAGAARTSPGITNKQTESQICPQNYGNWLNSCGGVAHSFYGVARTTHTTEARARARRGARPDAGRGRGSGPTRPHSLLQPPSSLLPPSSYHLLLNLA